MPPISTGIGSTIVNPIGRPVGVSVLSNGSGLAVGTDTLPFIFAYPWANIVGFGTKFSNPASALPGSVNAVEFGRVSEVMFCAHDTTPFVTAYAWNKTTGFGTKFANPGVLPNGNGASLAINTRTSSANYHVAVGQQAGSPPALYPFSKSGAGWGTKFAGPAAPDVGISNGVDFSPSGADIGWALSGTPFINAYRWTAAGFGTKYSNPGVLPASGKRFKFSTSGVACFLHGTNTPPLQPIAYAFVAGTGFGSQYTGIPQPPIWQDNNCQGLGVKSDAIVAGFGFGATYKAACTVWPWNDVTGFGASFAQPAVTPNTTGPGCTWNQSATTLFEATTNSPNVLAYPWGALGFGSKYANPGTPPAVTGGCIGVAL